jgi:hypothetical protein
MVMSQKSANKDVPFKAAILHIIPWMGQYGVWHNVRMDVK